LCEQIKNNLSAPHRNPSAVSPARLSSLPASARKSNGQRRPTWFIETARLNFIDPEARLRDALTASLTGTR